MKQSVPSLKFIVASMNGSAAKNPSFRGSDYFIVDQCGVNKSPVSDEFGATWFSTDSVGLSNSRNIAINCCAADILVITDSDVRHLDCARSVIANAFVDSGADIVTFQIQAPDGSPFKEYPDRRLKHTRRSIFRVNSIEIALRASSIAKAGISFDPRFGLGSNFPTGEEVIFLFDAIRAGLNLQYIPIPISVHPKESSGSNFYRNKNLAKAKGAMFGRIFPRSAIFYCFLFAIRHYRKSGFSFVYFFVLLICGYYLFLSSSREFSA